MNLYFVLEPKRSDYNAYISDIPKNLPKTYLFLKRLSLSAGWPDVSFKYCKNHKEGIDLTDLLGNSLSLFLISGKFKALIESFTPSGIEMLPMKTLNHKGRLTSADYFIVNFLVFTPAVDRSASIFDPDVLYPDQIGTTTKLELTSSVRKNGPAILRIAEKPRMILIREDLKSALESAGLTGMRYRETSTYSYFINPE